MTAPAMDEELRGELRDELVRSMQLAAIGSRGELEVFGEWIGFEVGREPLWDPEGARIRS